MSDFHPDDYVAGPDGQLVEKTETNTAKWRKDLERRAKKGDEAVNALEAIRRELALTRAGVPDSALGAMFSKAYDGPIDDPEAIRAAWAEISPGVQDPRVTQALDGSQQAMDLAAGAQAAPSGSDTEMELRKIKDSHRGPHSWEDGKEAVKRFMHEKYGPEALDKLGLTGRNH